MSAPTAAASPCLTASIKGTDLIAASPEGAVKRLMAARSAPVTKTRT